MIFHKINKIAKDIFRMVTNKLDNAFAEEDDFNVAAPKKDVLDDFPYLDDDMSSTRKFDLKGLGKKTAEKVSDSVSEFFNKDVKSDDITAGYKETSQKTTELLDKLNKDIAQIRSESVLINDSINKLTYTISSTEKKLSDISSSLSGLNKVSDSIFDLKNSQVNTKNSLSDLEFSFRSLKRKMTVSIIITSIIAVIIVGLEILNLLS